MKPNGMKDEVYTMYQKDGFTEQDIERIWVQTLITRSLMAKRINQEPKEVGKAPAMIVFCAFQQLQMLMDYGKQYGFNNAYPLIFIKKSSSQVLKANMKIVGGCEYALVLYRDKLPKFNNDGKMIMNWFDWETDSKYPKLHPTQKPIPVLKRLISIFTDYGDVVIDPVAGSGSTLRAALELNRSAYGFEIKKDFYESAKKQMLVDVPMTLKL